MLSGEEGEIVARFMNLLVKLGEKFGAEKMLPVASTQIAGISYKNIGDAGLEFLEEIAKGNVRVRVPSFMNPAGMDLELWEKLGISGEFAEKQKRIINALKEMGVIPVATCTPYLAGLLPRYAEHVAWSESSAVIFANSLLGARTNREGAFSALASAITGRTPCYGMHLEENRAPTFRVTVHAKIRDESDFSVLARFVCKHFSRGVPFFEGMKGSADELKILGATLAAYGAFALFHVKGITPEAGKFEKDAGEVEKITAEESDLLSAKREINREGEEPELIFFGCPHCSISEIRRIAELLKGRKMRKRFFIFTSRTVKETAERSGIAESVRKSGGEILCDTCPVVMPPDSLGARVIATNSGKACFYLRNQGFKVILGSVRELIEKFSVRL